MSQIVCLFLGSPPDRGVHHPRTPCIRMLRAASKLTPNAESQESKVECGVLMPTWLPAPTAAELSLWVCSPAQATLTDALASLTKPLSQEQRP